MQRTTIVQNCQHCLAQRDFQKRSEAPPARLPRLAPGPGRNNPNTERYRNKIAVLLYRISPDLLGNESILIRDLFAPFLFTFSERQGELERVRGGTYPKQVRPAVE